jgi:hypothetical protein
MAATSAGAENPDAVTAHALYVYAADEPDETSLAVGEEIIVLRRPNAQWWYGVTQAGEGFFPAEYVKAAGSASPGVGRGRSRTVAEQVLDEATSIAAETMTESVVSEADAGRDQALASVSVSLRRTRSRGNFRNTGSLEVLLLAKSDMEELAGASAASEQKHGAAPIRPTSISTINNSSSGGSSNNNNNNNSSALKPPTGQKEIKRISFFQNPKEDLARMLESGNKAKTLMDKLKRDASFFYEWIKHRNTVLKSSSLGEIFIKHKNRRGQKRFVYVPNTKKGYLLVWCKSQNSAKSNKYQGSIPVSEIRAVVPGVASEHFKRTAKAKCSFSIVGRERTLDLECDNLGMCQKWTKFFQDILLIALVSEVFIKKCRVAHNKLRHQAATQVLASTSHGQENEQPPDLPASIPLSSGGRDVLPVSPLPPPPAFRASLFDKLDVSRKGTSAAAATPAVADAASSMFKGTSATAAAPAVADAASSVFSTSVFSTRRTTFLPDGWERGEAENGERYYYDAVNERSTWSKPPGNEPELPEGWTAHVSDDGTSYYYHEASGRSSWTVPETNTEPSSSRSSLSALDMVTEHKDEKEAEAGVVAAQRQKESTVKKSSKRQTIQPIPLPSPGAPVPVAVAPMHASVQASKKKAEKARSPKMATKRSTIDNKLQSRRRGRRNRR